LTDNNEKLNALMATLSRELNDRMVQAVGKTLPYVLIVMGTEETKTNTPDTSPLRVVTNETDDGLLMLGNMLHAFAQRRKEAY
jgi:hypothetical protein